ncbi:MAG: UDP-3-O-acyl-N-acetylglucosamine deacetylase [Verrucomicrobia bacterium]|nr:UDP-3-O-acyl-N-acetylglucosamine deacetylase [Verrucomicrobiota bacterium]MBU1910341.1 UDP-3-O-acyl-N-acetylglucosamine deacetylase [Verrucomicrobiota bacterium]
MTRQTTLRTSSDWLYGRHLDQDGKSGLRFHPAAEEEGLVFVRADLPGRPEVRCRPENLRSMPRWTALEEGGVEVHHTEHVLAALALCGVDNAVMEMDCSRVPMTAGFSSAAFCEALMKAGSRPLEAPRRVYTLKAPLFYLDSQRTTGEVSGQPSLADGRYVVGIPADRLAVSYVFHWSHLPSLPIGVAEYDESVPAAWQSFAGARSYLVQTEAEAVREVLGPARMDVMMLAPHCSPALAQEAARHKILDFVGDLMILGHPVRGRFAAFRTGHRIHHNLVRYLVENNLLETRRE